MNIKIILPNREDDDFLLKQVDAAVFAVCNHFFGPEGYLNLTDVSFFKYEHAQP